MDRRIIAASTLLATALSTTVLASADAAPSHHVPASARAGAFSVTASVNETEPLLGTKVTIKATVRPAAPGAEVALQVRYADRKSWKTIDHGRLSGAGKVTFKDRVGSVRQRLYRVVKPAAGNRGAGQGTAPKVTVFGWRNVTSLQAVQNAGFTGTASLSLNGTAYPDSLYSSTTGTQPFHVDYNLNHDCKQLKGTFGLDDRSPIAGAATLSLTADGTQKYVGSFGLTQAQQIITDVTNAFRISIAATSSGGGIGALGSPQVLCSF